MNLLLKKFIGVFSSIIASGALLVVYFFPSRFVLLAVIALWWSFLFWSAHFFSFGSKNLFLQLSTTISSVALLSLVEWEHLHWFLILLNGIIFWFLWHWSLADSEDTGKFQYKTLRRLVIILWVFNMYAWFTILFALHTFFQNIPLWILSLIAGAFGGVGASTIWSLYFKSPMVKYTLWMLIVGLAVIELMWIMQLLPLGYLALGILLTWLWYLGQLFVRFHLTLRGIIWKQQRIFVAANIILYILTLYIMRWI